STETTTSSPLSLHDALPIWKRTRRQGHQAGGVAGHVCVRARCRSARRYRIQNGHGWRHNRTRPAHRLFQSYTLVGDNNEQKNTGDRKSTRLNSSHVKISYAV